MLVSGEKQDRSRCEGADNVKSETGYLADLALFEAHNRAHSMVLGAHPAVIRADFNNFWLYHEV